MQKPLGKEELALLAARGGLTVKELLNPKSTGFRSIGLDLDAVDDDQAARLINANPKIMRRPLLTDGTGLAVGFDPGQYSALVK